MLLFEHEAFIDEKPERAAGVEYGRHITLYMMMMMMIIIMVVLNTVVCCICSQEKDRHPRSQRMVDPH
jgi:heme/copper-type cytochrome/quinol oxidase subunit 2